MKGLIYLDYGSYPTATGLGATSGGLQGLAKHLCGVAGISFSVTLEV